MLSVPIVWLSKLTVLSLQALCRLPGAPVSAGGLGIRFPTGLAPVVSRASQYTFLIVPLSFDLTILKPKNATAVSLLIMCQPVSTPWGGYLHIISALEIFNSRIITPERKEPTLSDSLWAVPILHFHHHTLTKADFSTEIKSRCIMFILIHGRPVEKRIG